MLSLNLKTIRAAHEQFAYQYEPAHVSRDDDDFSVSDPVRLAFDVYKDATQFRLVGRVQTTLVTACARCLETFARPVDLSFDLRYQPHSANDGEGEREVEEDDLTTAFYEDDAIDLGQLMREQFYLSMPMKPLCAVGCRGLCPVCGTSLNVGACECAGGWEDPRFAALKALKNETSR